jgi:hypothetical protein
MTPEDHGQARTLERLLVRGNTIAVVAAATLRGIVADHDIGEEEILRYADELMQWSADVRAVASEQMP